MTEQQDQRQANGRFAKGNRGGPGRPRRRVEIEYLAALSAGVPLARWRRIVKRAVDDAENGNAQARVFLARYLLGSDANLLQLSARETLGLTPDDEVDAVAAELQARERAPLTRQQLDAIGKRLGLQNPDEGGEPCFGDE